MPARRTRGDGGLTQRHDHKSCPPTQVLGVDDDGNEIQGRPKHKCRGRWQGSVPVSQGSTQKKYVYGATKGEAQTKLREAVNAKATGTLVITGLTVEAWLWHWLDNIAEVRPQTYRGYKSKIRAYLVPHLGRHKLSSLQPDHIRLMYREMREKGLAEASLRQTHAILARALKVAMQEGKIARNPIEAVKPPSTKTKRRAQLSVAQARSVLGATDDARWWLAVFYGMRQGEVLGLRWCDVDFETGQMYVNQTLQKDRDGRLFFGPPKSDAGERVVPLVPVMAARLKLRHTEVGSPPPWSEELVFGHPKKPGRPRDSKKDWEAWRVLLEAASTDEDKLPKVSLHSARNTAASLLEAADVPPRLVGQIIGHSNVKQTEHYQHAAAEQMLTALEAGASLLSLAELDVAQLDEVVVEPDEPNLID
jgi:integrase